MVLRLEEHLCLVSCDFLWLSRVLSVVVLPQKLEVQKNSRETEREREREREREKKNKLGEKAE